MRLCLRRYETGSQKGREKRVLKMLLVGLTKCCPLHRELLLWWSQGENHLPLPAQMLTSQYANPEGQHCHTYKSEHQSVHCITGAWIITL